MNESRGGRMMCVMTHSSTMVHRFLLHSSYRSFLFCLLPHLLVGTSRCRTLYPQNNTYTREVSKKSLGYIAPRWKILCFSKVSCVFVAIHVTSFCTWEGQISCERSVYEGGHGCLTVDVFLRFWLLMLYYWHRKDGSLCTWSLAMFVEPVAMDLCTALATLPADRVV
jgi:hypothetical protein